MPKVFIPVTLVFSVVALYPFMCLKIHWSSCVDLNFCKVWVGERGLGQNITRAFIKWLCVSILLSWVCAFQLLSLFISISEVLTSCSHECQYAVGLYTDRYRPWFWKIWWLVCSFYLLILVLKYLRRKPQSSWLKTIFLHSKNAFLDWSWSFCPCFW